MRALEREREQISQTRTLYHNLDPAVHHNTPRPSESQSPRPSRTDSSRGRLSALRTYELRDELQRPRPKFTGKPVPALEANPRVLSRVRSCLYKHRRKCSTISPKMSDRRYIYSMTRFAYVHTYSTSKVRCASRHARENENRKANYRTFWVFVVGICTAIFSPKNYFPVPNILCGIFSGVRTATPDSYQQGIFKARLLP